MFVHFRFYFTFMQISSEHNSLSLNLSAVSVQHLIYRVNKTSNGWNMIICSFCRPSIIDEMWNANLIPSWPSLNKLLRASGPHSKQCSHLYCNIKGVNEAFHSLTLKHFFRQDCLCHACWDYNDTATVQFLNPSWLSEIPKIKPLSEITMPGIHNNNNTALYGCAITQ